MAQKQAAKKGQAGEALAVSAGIAALAAASYYFLGPKGKKHRGELKSWSIKMKGDVVEKLEKLKDVSEPVYHQIIDVVAAKYARQGSAAQADIEALARELKRTWRSVASSAKAIRKPSARPSSKPRSKTASTKKSSARKNT